MRVKHEAYLKMFGPPGDRTPLGAVILEDLDLFCKRGNETLHFDSTGRLDPYTTIYRDGKKAVADRIHAMIEWRGYDDSSSSSDER